MPVTLLTRTELYHVGAEFRCLDWARTAHDELWPDGSVWLWEGRDEHRVKVVAGIPVRDDGAVLHTTQSRHEWREEHAT